jgi:hypothetical protein
MACVNARIMLMHVMDGRTDRHYCADSCHIVMIQRWIEGLSEKVDRRTIREDG